MFIYILILVFVIILLFVFLDIKITINYKKLYYKNNLEDSEKDLVKNTNKITIYIFNFIKIKTLDIDKLIKKENEIIIEKEKEKGIENKNYILSLFTDFNLIKGKIITKYLFEFIHKIKVDKLYLSLNYKINNMYFNIYSIVILNIIFSMFVSKYNKCFNFDDFYYNFSMSQNEKLNFNFNSIIRFKLVNTIIIGIKIIFKILKEEKRYGKRTSNRKLNDDCYDFT